VIDLGLIRDLLACDDKKDVGMFQETTTMLGASTKERQQIADELEKRHGTSIEAATTEMYEKEPGAIGTALTYFACGCVLLRCFDDSGDTITTPRVVADENSCDVDHINNVEGTHHAAIYNSILWNVDQEQFDRTYGNEHRIIIARRLFPPGGDE
jgi:hypothetical protein